MVSRLLTEREAKAYCGGVPPHDVAPPLRFGADKLRWDRNALDARLDRLSGLTADVPHANDAEAELADWTRKHATRRP